MKKNKFQVGDIVKINKNVTLADIASDYFEGCQIDTMNFLKKASSEDFEGIYEVESVSLNGKPMIDRSIINSKVLTVINRPILNEKERKYLSATIKPFRKKIDYVKKGKLLQEEFICISLNNNTDFFDFPSFKLGTMYKGMKVNRAYSLEELEL